MLNRRIFLRNAGLAMVGMGTMVGSATGAAGPPDDSNVNSNVDPSADPKRDPKAVESGSEIGCARRNSDSDLFHLVIWRLPGRRELGVTQV